MEYTYTSTPSTTVVELDPAMLLTIMMIAFLFFLAIYIFMALTYAALFKKAGEAGWKGWVPIYNTWTLNEIAGRPGWWALLNFIPFVGLVTTIISLVDLVKSFGKDTAYVLLLIFLPIIGFPILAFGSSRYNGPAGPEQRLNWNSTPPQQPFFGQDQPPQNPQPPTFQ